MVKIDKNKALFLKGVIIANGIPDSDGDVLNKKEIKQLISSFLSHQTDTNHDFLQNMGVKIIENYISQTEETISGHKIPAGSWIANIMTWDNELNSLIRQNRLDGLSLASQPDADAKPDITNIVNKRRTYAQYKDMDKLTPTFISIVKNPSNGIPFEYFSYQTYITKNKGQEEVSVSEETKELSKIATSLIELVGTQLNGVQSVDNTPVTKAAPPQGGVAPTMQQPVQQYAPAPQMQPPSMQSIDQKLDQLIQIMSGQNQIQKSKEDEKSEEKNEETEKKASEKTENDSEGAKAEGNTGEGTVQKEEKKNDETGQPQTEESGASLNQTSPTANNNVPPSNEIEGETPKGVERHIVKSAPPQTSNSTVTEPVIQSYSDQSIGTHRDALGKPIRD